MPAQGSNNAHIRDEAVRGPADAGGLQEELGLMR